MFRRNPRYVQIFGLITVGILLSVGLLLSGCEQKRSATVEEKKPEVFKVGAVLALTGSASVWGENVRKGMELALDEIHAAGGVKGKKIEIIYEDSQSDPTKAVAALQKVISTAQVPVVIGDIASSNVLAMAPVAESEKVVLISPGASNPDISHAGEYIYRNFPSDALEGRVDADYAFQQLKWKKVAILYIKNAYGEGVFRVFKEAFTKHGGIVILEDSFNQGAIDFRAQLTKVKNITVDGIFLPGYPDEMAKLLKQAKELGVKKPFLSTQAFDDPQVLKIAGEAAEGVVFSTPEPPSDADPIVANFRQNYKKKYGKDIGLMSDTGYDALKIVAVAIERGGYSVQAIKAQFDALKNYPGAAGSTTFDQYGDVPKPVIFKVVKKGEFVNTGYRVAGNH